MEFRYYKMPSGSPILALLGDKWVQSYGNDTDYLHFHNYLEIGYCYDGRGELVLGEQSLRFKPNQFTIIPKNYPHTTNSNPGTISYWEYLFVDEESLLREYHRGGEFDQSGTYAGSDQFPGRLKECIRIACDCGDDPADSGNYAGTEGVLYR